MTEMYYHIVKSPICPILLAGDDEGLKHLIFLKDKEKVKIPDDWVENEDFFRETSRQLARAGKSEIL